MYILDFVILYNSASFHKILVRQLVISVRLALQEGVIGEWAKHFTGYLVTLLVIFYMQIVNKLPSILSLQTNADLQPMKCGGLFVHFFFLNHSLSRQRDIG